MERRILLFDYDGTVADSFKVSFNAFRKIAAKYGLEKVKTKQDFADIYRKNFYVSLENMGLKRDSFLSFAHEFRDPFVKNQDKIKIFKGMKTIIEKLSKNNEIFVISSNLKEVIESSVKFHGLKGVSKVLGGGDGVSKIDKIKKIILENPNSVVYYIGDTSGDVLEANKAGAVSVGVLWGYHSKKYFQKSGAKFLLKKPSELIELFC